MLDQNYVIPVVYNSCYEKPPMYTEVAEPSATMHRNHFSLRKMKTGLKVFMFERRNRREKKPQDGKTNPME
ncbi:hypothetical protein HPULCUR_005001 [Helicostylum pulchrum]|uniref:Uncharacterized protein n=1 Tax=Helicostylum pulchrum TaxID=562976 RepID=A0ABP9XYW1_9FUNG